MYALRNSLKKQTYRTAAGVELNTYSPVDASVRGAIGQRLKEVYERAAADREALFWPWLMTRFEQVLQHEPDELERWKCGLGVNPATRTGASEVPHA
jgi:hypothetical protein